MIRVKLFYGASSVEELNDFLSTVNVIDVKYQMTDDSDGFLVIYEDSNLSNIPTCKLVEELMKREGVTAHKIAPHEQQYMILCKANNGKRFGEDGIHCSEVLASGETGGAIILEVID